MPDLKRRDLLTAGASGVLAAGMPLAPARTQMLEDPWAGYDWAAVPPCPTGSIRALSPIWR